MSIALSTRHFYPCSVFVRAFFSSPRPSHFFVCDTSANTWLVQKAICALRFVTHGILRMSCSFNINDIIIDAIRALRGRDGPLCPLDICARIAGRYFGVSLIKALWPPRVTRATNVSLFGRVCGTRCSFQSYVIPSRCTSFEFRTVPHVEPAFTDRLHSATSRILRPFDVRKCSVLEKKPSKKRNKEQDARNEAGGK